MGTAAVLYWARPYILGVKPESPGVTICATLYRSAKLLPGQPASSRLPWLTQGTACGWVGGQEGI